MKFTLSDGRAGQAIGDPHFGRKFEVGVPINKRGLRELSQRRDFISQLEEDVDVCIVVGDVFDQPFVGFNVVQAVSDAIEGAVTRNSDRQYIIYAGNHDMPRNITAVGAFHDLEQRLRDRYDNLHIVRRPSVVTDIAIFPWEWDRRADEQVADLKDEQPLAAFGHWDLTLFEGKDDHLAPTKALHEAFGDIPLYTGHIHTPGEYIIHGHAVTCTGSLQPYSHGEDPESSLYVTEALSDVLSRPDGYYKDKILRVELKHGERLPDTVECMALTPKMIAGDEEEITQSLEDLGWKKLLDDTINGLDPEVQAFVKERLPDVSSA